MTTKHTYTYQIPDPEDWGSGYLYWKVTADNGTTLELYTNGEGEDRFDRLENASGVEYRQYKGTMQAPAMPQDAEKAKAELRREIGKILAEDDFWKNADLDDSDFEDPAWMNSDFESSNGEDIDA